MSQHGFGDSLRRFELDDSTHQRSKRQERDMFLGEVCSVSSLPLLRFPAKGAYTVSAIRERLAAYTVSQQRRSTEGDHSLADEDVAIAQEAAPLCPKCSGSMVLRTVRKGSAAGQKFWGCGDYPACRGTRPNRCITRRSSRRPTRYAVCPRLSLVVMLQEDYEDDPEVCGNSRKERTRSVLKTY